jgi:hypothetical protein
MPQEVEVTRTSIPAPSIDNPSRMVYQIMYRVGTLPPHFVYIEEKAWSDKAEKEAIQADIKKQLETKTTRISL